MKVIYAREKLPKNLGPSIFLAGPTPRSREVKSWRPEAIDYLRKRGFEGTVLVPEDRYGDFEEGEYIKQIEWEHAALEATTVIVFWIPRHLVNLPGFTTNVEFGEYLHSGKIILGAPDEAVKMRYLRKRAEMHGVPTFTQQIPTLEAALWLLKEGQ